MRTHNWRKPQTWPLTRRVFVLMIAATYLPLGYTLYGWGESSAVAPTTTVVNYYELPQSIQDARDACYEQVRVAHDVPSERNAYLVWWRDNKGSAAQLSWSADFEACKAANPMPGGKWNFAGMTLVRVGEL